MNNPNIDLMTAIAVGQREMHKRNIFKLSQERCNLILKLHKINNQLSEEANNFERMNVFLEGK